jgi:hypothetical protein
MAPTTQERNAIRELARQVADLAHQPVMDQRRRRWIEHNALRSTGPMVLVFPEGAWGELIGPDQLICQEGSLRWMELQLRQRLYAFEHFADDTVVEASWDPAPVIHSTGWGLEAKHSHAGAGRGAHGFEPVLTGPADLAKLRVPELTYDRKATERAQEALEELVGDILTVRPPRIRHISFHLNSQYLHLRGPTEMLMDMVDNPSMVHDALSLFAEGHRQAIEQYEQWGLLGLNNDNTYHSSGGNGYTDELPAEGFDGEHVRLKDMWGSAESQELAAVSPEMHAEFALAHERPLLERFALVGYGCCEDLTRKLDDVCAVPNMRRVSISPWADVDAAATRLKGDYIFSWKPKPSMLVGRFDPDPVESYIRHTVEVAAEHGCVLEMILKDTHTCQGHPERFDAWTKIARRVVDEAGG